MTIDLDRLAMSDLDVARLTKPQRTARVRELVDEAHTLYYTGRRRFILDDGKEHAATVILFSGGNDSTVLAHLFKSLATHAGHANTGIGVEQTRQYVRDTCATWGLPLLERSAPNPQDSYEAMVLDQGFPGPAHHYKMFQRLKERALRVIRNEILAGRNRTHRVIYLAGRRRQESDRRADIPEFERDGSIVWISPLVNWTKLDMTTYRLMASQIGDPVPVNEVSDLIHMSGECLCGAFAHAGELDEVGMWYPDVKSEIEALEAKVLATGKHPEWKCRWGWGADKGAIEKMKRSGMSDFDIAALFARSTTGALCSSCDARSNPDRQEATVAHSHQEA